MREKEWGWSAKENSARNVIRPWARKRGRGWQHIQIAQEMQWTMPEKWGGEHKQLVQEYTSVNKYAY